MPAPGLFADLSWRGLVHQATDPGLSARLDSEVMTAYAGFDPTGDSLHLGHLVGIVGLVRFQRYGHRPIAVAGGGTGMIGDPSGKSDERQLLTAEALRSNTATIRDQLARFLDFGPGGAVLVDNADWLAPLPLLDFLRDVGKHFTVNAMVAKESVRSRLAEREQGISFTEFSYMLLQALDFLHLYDTHGCRLQLGGSDQWGNITAGIDLIRRRRGGVAYGLTWPLVTTADGTKFGKTEAGTSIWLDPARTSPYALYQSLVRTGDEQVGAYLRYFTFRSAEEIAALDELTATRPGERAASRALAADVVTLVHGADEAGRAERASRVLFSEEIRSLDEVTLLAVTADAPSTDVDRASFPGMTVVEALVLTGLASSGGAARQLVAGGGVYVNNRRVEGPEASLVMADLLHGRYAILRRGKAHQHVLRAV